MAEYFDAIGEGKYFAEFWRLFIFINISIYWEIASNQTNCFCPLLA